MSAYNVGDAEQVGRQAKIHKSRMARRDAGFRRLLSDAEGRAWVWELLSMCGVFRTSFNQSNATTAFNEGQRNVGLAVLADINRLCPEEYLRMLKESQMKEQNNA